MKFLPVFLRLGLRPLKTVYIPSRFKLKYLREGQLNTMKLDTPIFQKLFTPELQRLESLFSKYGHELRIAGGAVRDLLMDIEPHDVDFATTATPDQMKEMFEKEKVRMINNKGEKHGTITARINDKENFEVTTLRIDVVTDGRHAEVEFTHDWHLDAGRRDLTINAMFLGFDGTLYDYFNGKEDLDARRLRFVGSPSERICEDYLRILRYFRFYGRIAKGPDCHEKDILTAIEENKGGLAGVSGERLWMELRKILCGRFNEPIMQTMLKLGIGQYIGLSDNVNVDEFARVCINTSNMDPLPITVLTGLLLCEDDVQRLNKRLKMSNEETRTASFIVKHREDKIDLTTPMRYCMDLYNDTVGKEPKVKDRIIELLKYKGKKDLLDQFVEWIPQKFPVTGHDLFMMNVPKGPVFAKALHELRQIWKGSNYSMSKEDLLSQLHDVLKRIQ